MHQRGSLLPSATCFAVEREAARRRGEQSVVEELLPATPPPHVAAALPEQRSGTRRTPSHYELAGKQRRSPPTVVTR
nr:hypothetical protein Itr_chr07CG10430 [Ipomoea trifida]GLL31497.1 hypothetical protein Itr_chr07CG10440 [Ipomoea trifida]